MSLEDPVITLEDIMVIIIIIMEDQEESLVVIIVEKEVHNLNGMAVVLQVLIPSQTTIMEEVSNGITLKITQEDPVIIQEIITTIMDTLEAHLTIVESALLKMLLG